MTQMGTLSKYGHLSTMATIITSIRILCSIALLFFPVFSPSFYTLYIVAGVSDMIDGTVARKTGSASEFGSKLDTVADCILVAVCLIKLIPVLDIPSWLYIWVIIIALIKVFNIIYGYVKHKELVAAHTVMNKITGVLLFILPLTVPIINLKYTGVFVSAVATFAAIREGQYIRARRCATSDVSKRGLTVYLLIEALLLCLVETGECAGWSTMTVQVLMYTAILINTAVVAYHFYTSGAYKKKESENLIAYALFTTAVADFFMTLIGAPVGFLPGVLLFCLVQVVYALYLSPYVEWFLIRAVFFAASVLCLKVAGMMSLENVFGLLDVSLLLINAVLAWTLARERTSWLFRMGITLFLCCDVSIVLRTLTTGSVHDMINYLVWVFYIPSQVALSLSYIKQKTGIFEYPLLNQH